MASCESDRRLESVRRKMRGIIWSQNMKRFAPVSTSILLFFGNRHNHITVFDETIFVSSMTLYPQAGQTYIHLLFLRCKMLVGKSQTLELHPTDAGYAFLQNAFLGLRRSVQPSRNRDDRKNLAVVRTTAPLAEIMKKAPKNFYAIGKFIIAMLLQHYSADAILK